MEKKDIEIPFGAFDSELGGFEYTIPEGYEAEIKDGKVIVRKTESEDEKIRRLIKNVILKSVPYPQNVLDGGESITAEDAIAWLEKQGEQKPADKVEPKFKVGDWLVHKDLVGVTCCITQIHAPHYYLTNNNSFIKFGEEDNYRPWTIQDAKDDDVLSWDDSKCIALFKNIYDKDSFNSYGFVGGCTGTFESRMSYHDIEGAHPATKEQRDLLFQKMHESGYTFDFEKKELKKIEQPKQEWSEKDEAVLDALIQRLEGEDIYVSPHLAVECLKSIKDRVQLQPQSHWKPTEEHLKGLRRGIKNTEEGSDAWRDLKDLYEQLKALL